MSKTTKTSSTPTPAPAAAPAPTPAPAEAPAAPAIPKGYWEAADGSLVPESKVTAVDKARDAIVRQLVADATKTSADLAAFKAAALQAVEAFCQRSAAEYGVQLRGAAGKGNVSLVSYDGRFKVERQVADRIAFDERLQVAKQLIDDCVRGWLKGSNDHIKVIVNDAFKVDRQGRIPVSKVLDLRRHKISDAAWLKAMDAISDSVTAVGSATYVRFYRRSETTGEYLPIPLTAAAV